MVENYQIRFSTHGKVDVIDLSSRLEEILHKSSIKNGQLYLFAIGSTGALTTIEYEPGLKKDIKEFFDELIPYGKNYHHHETWHDDNGSSHLQSALLKPNLNVPIQDGKLILGSYQQVVFVDFDTRSRARTVHCQLMGE
ncbi:MAG: secondary thiamine-phosphate synthase enzyme YjbQ [Spirochaetota bacterium]|nr:secondary thiamine-phosphate synthase enzyme YjbQ [Spirochaetota bacterium]